tara:strand:+ start:354 stop:479 length:126 start_codon:yes stop_codon:yes gene_type:complete
MNNTNSHNFLFHDVSTVKGVGSKLKKYLKKKENRPGKRSII